MSQKKKDSKFLKAFGEPKRATVCASERNNSVALDQSLQLMNGKYLLTQLDKVNFNPKLKAEEQINELYIRAYSRQPKPSELAIAMKHFQSINDHNQAIKDIYWAVINSNEFMFQHQESV